MISSIKSSFLYTYSSSSTMFVSLLSTCYFIFSPNLFVGCRYQISTRTKKLSSLAAIAHLFAKYLETFPLFFPIALPINDVLYKSPYFGVFVFCFKARNKAFSAPKIWIVEAGYLERVFRDPEWAMSLAATDYPMRVVRLGETTSILSFRYYCIYLL